MPLQLTNIVPGTLPEPVFDLLVTRAKLTSPSVIAAVRDHLVFGLGKQEAWEKHQVNQGSVSSRIKMLLDEAEKLDVEMKMLIPYLMPASRPAIALSEALSRAGALTLELSGVIHDALKAAGVEPEDRAQECSAP